MLEHEHPTRDVASVLLASGWALFGIGTLTLAVVGVTELAATFGSFCWTDCSPAPSRPPEEASWTALGMMAGGAISASIAALLHALASDAAERSGELARRVRFDVGPAHATLTVTLAI